MMKYYLIYSVSYIIRKGNMVVRSMKQSVFGIYIMDDLNGFTNTHCCNSVQSNTQNAEQDSIASMSTVALIRKETLPFKN